MLAIYFLISAVIVGSLAEVNNNDNLLPNGITLPPEFEKKIKDPEVEKMKTKFKEAFVKKCEANNHSLPPDSLETAVSTFVKCLTSLVNMTELEAEVEAAKPIGSVDEVFKKYCEKRPQFLQCFMDMTDTVKPCFNEKEQNNIKVLHNITSNLAEFICYKDGERIALFIAEGGKECFESKQVEVQSCFNETFGVMSQDDLKDTSFSFINSPVLEFEKEQCDQIDTFKKCVVDTFSKCEPPTTGNIVESLFNFIRKATPCTKSSKTSKLSGFASRVSLSTATLVAALAALTVV